MGRNDALPKGFFGKIEPKRRIPANNIMAVGVFALVGAVVLELFSRQLGGGAYETGAQALNFGAFIAFMGVNAASFVRYFIREGQRKVSHMLVPVIGFGVCAFIWWNLSMPAKILGTVWVVLGLIYGAVKTHGFRDIMRFEEAAE
jgi:amino acid transporter